MQRRVVGLGLAVLDHLLRVDDFGLRGGRIRYRGSLLAAGGMVATALAQAAQLGCRAELLSMVGRDPEGRQVARELRGFGVSTRRLVHSDRHPTTTTVVLVEHETGERRFIVPDRRALERSAPDFDLSGIAEGSVLLVDGHFPAQARRAIERARACGAPIVADFSDARAAHLRLLRHVDYPVVSLEFVESWGQGGARETLHALRDYSGGTPVVTLGERGAIALVRGRVLQVPPRRVRALDTTGAGDVFHGAFAAGLCQGAEVEAALELATRAASRCCTALGGTGNLLRREESNLSPSGRA